MVKKISPFAINLEQKCIDKGLRLTDQRKVIVKLLEETIMDTKFHPDVDEIHKRAVAIDKKISIATVYRTVKLLEEADIIDRHEFKEGRDRDTKQLQKITMTT
jgi:Fur family ferric uptake transcriptional regulator